MLLHSGRAERASRHVDHDARRLDRVDGESLSTGDAAKITGETELGLNTDVGAELILIDVPLEFESVGLWAGD
jgi:hypothetical protein